MQTFKMNETALICEGWKNILMKATQIENILAVFKIFWCEVLFKFSG